MDKWTEGEKKYKSLKVLILNILSNAVLNGTFGCVLYFWSLSKPSLDVGGKRLIFPCSY